MARSLMQDIQGRATSYHILGWQGLVHYSNLAAKVRVGSIATGPAGPVPRLISASLRKRPNCWMAN